MYHLDPAIIRDAHERPAQALGDVGVLRQSPVHSAAYPPGSLVADPLGQQFDVLFRPGVKKSNNWAIWWSDLMMAMFVMFAALYIFQLPQKLRTDLVPEVPVEQEYSPISGGESLLFRIYEQGREAIQRHNLEAMIATQLVPGKSARFILAGDQVFDLGQVQMKPAPRSALQVLAPILRQGPYTLTLVGHASVDEKKVSGLSSPWDLPLARAKALADFLLECGVPEQAIIVAGYGEQDGFWSKSRNFDLGRRVEIVLSPENPIEPLSTDEISGQSKAGIRAWMSRAGTGGE